MIEVKSLQTLFSGKCIVQAIETLVDGVEQPLTERILLKPRVTIVTHDIVNDKVVLVHDYKVGSMAYTSEFPSGEVEVGELAYNAARRILKGTTGLAPKSIEIIHSLMLNPSDTYAPHTLFYVTVDTRDIIEDKYDNLRVIGGKELIREVNALTHDSLGIIMGAQYIKSNRKRK